MNQCSLSSYLTRLITLSLLPLILLASVFAFYIVREQQNDIQEQAQALADNIANNIDNYLDSRIKALGVLAYSPYVYQKDQWEAFYNEALAFRKSFDSHVILADVSSQPMQMLFNTRVPFDKKLPSLPVPKGKTAVQKSLQTRRPSVGDTFQGPFTNETLIAIAVPVIDDADINYAMINAIETRLFQDRIDQMVFPTNWRLQVQDSKGDNIVIRNVGNATSPPTDTNFQLIESFPSLAGNWRVSLHIPKTSVFGPVFSAALLFASLILLTALGGIIAGKIASRRLGRQVAGLAAHSSTDDASDIIEIAQAQNTLNQKEAALIDSEKKYRELFKSNPNPMWIYDIETLEFIEVNDAALKKYGYRRDEFLTKTIKDIRPEEDIQRLLDNVATLSNGLDDAGTWTHITKDGQILYVEIMSHYLVYEGRKAELVLAIDVTQKKLAERSLQSNVKQQQILAELGFDAMKKEEHQYLFEETCSKVVAGLDASHSILFTKTATGDFIVSEHYGWKTESVESIRQLVDLPSELIEIIEANAPSAISYSQIHQSSKSKQLLDSENILSIFASPLSVNGDIRGLLAVYSTEKSAFSPADSSFLQSICNILSAAMARIEINEKLGFMAMHDGLTKLPNRSLLTDRFNQITAQSKRSQKPIALLFLDLDRFKNLNDVFGHSTGDHVLKEVASRLERCVRASDSVCRQGGDEFLILLNEMEHPEDAVRVAEKILTAINYPISVNNTELVLGGTIGIACYPDDGEDMESLMRCADTAMYFAKNTGRNRYQFYSEEMSSRSLERLMLEGDLRQAIAKNQLFIVYQPQLNLLDNTIIGAEALVRWQHPEHGLIPPSSFIPIAEESGLIQEIGSWVMEHACAQFNQWVTAKLFNCTIAINVSSYQFQQANFSEIVELALQKSGLPPQNLELEVTESVVMQGHETVIKKLQQLNKLGVKLAIDDFGTGYSSLSYLQKFPINRLKIDQSFVKGLPGDSGSSSIVKAIIELGHALNMEVLAEGIETIKQDEFLQAADCESGQGYLFSMPLTVEEFEDKWLS